MINYVRLVLPDSVHRNFGIECYLQDNSKVIEFQQFCLEKFPREKFGTFFQGGHMGNGYDPYWRYFEFWMGENHQAEILDLAMEIANTLGYDLQMF